ncbi:penicillin-binding protein activator LpoB [Cupriavidus pinatubonensis]|uniref:penicillin-binding protein activator LpoB n=1 Tax=Cupriavidus pinatubonensis TaxID=248026 RepID=UPI00112A68D0|nr:penicillin-binding protein activator LpoB [Cupriavidus pinatubonensis]TPQ43922.1 penicillin-binding protein activator LpoB [Cupriavidus pinatubonensis]
MSLSLRHALAVAALPFLVTGCAMQGAGVPAIDVDLTRKGPVSGVGIEGQDIVAVTDQMMRDILADPAFANTAKRPRVIIDSAYFVNESSQPINRNLITQRLLVNLNRAARSRMQFVNRAQSAMVEQERALKRAGVTDTGTTGMTKATLGADYRLSGRIGSLDSRSAQTGMIQRYTQIAFELTDLESGELIWSGLYEFSRAATDDIVYR